MSIRDFTSLGGFIILILTMLINIVKTSTLKNNHLHHLSLDIGEVKESLKETLCEVKEQSVSINKVSERLVRLETSLNSCQQFHNK